MENIKFNTKNIYTLIAILGKKGRIGLPFMPMARLKNCLIVVLGYTLTVYSAEGCERYDLVAKIYNENINDWEFRYWYRIFLNDIKISNLPSFESEKNVQTNEISKRKTKNSIGNEIINKAKPIESKIEQDCFKTIKRINIKLRTILKLQLPNLYILDNYLVIFTHQEIFLIYLETKIIRM
ncbi:hypothetical protein EDEG_01798 [Edhazardia aedis USNM 41457]|uniref:Uncharacterized protein n=1 Tax=Edhazardia aedis (strain USNM 41457) TaxID=1003232 RepID=J9DMW5_EDHAE|nr:hypothetical protein EDEG_01798 [Edhazardia aedis USNM 41457]|eukprot:EJW03910.1 hypothetical protein EDEG_01798 [Edhazardia aedis USNM 41457]